MHLPTFFCGFWKGARSINNCYAHNGCIVLDFDNVGGDVEINSLKNKLLNSVYGESIALMFKSPSGNGLKVVIATNLNNENFATGAVCFLEQVEKELGVPVDKSCKDKLRACFLSLDENAYINEHYQVYNVEIVEKPKPVKQRSVSGNAEGVLLPSGVKKCNNNAEYAYQLTLAGGRKFEKGGRHNFVVSYAGFCFFSGVSLNDSIEFARNSFLCDGDFDFERDVAYHIQDIYQRNTIQYGEQRVINAVNDNYFSVDNDTITVNKYITETDESHQFYYEKIVISKERRILVQAPTGAGKTQAVKLTVQRAVDEGYFSKALIIAPNIIIGEQIAQELNKRAINQYTKSKDKTIALNEDVIIATYNKMEYVVTKLIEKGIPKEKILVIADEAHSFIEEFRQKVMDETHNCIKDLGKIIYLTATPPDGFFKLLGIEKVFKYEVIQQNKKRIVIHNSNDKKVLAYQIKKYIDNNPGKILPIFLNSGAKIQSIIQYLIKECGLTNEQIGVLAADGLLEKNRIVDYDVSESINSTGMIPANKRILFLTSCAEYGVNILNENIDNFFIWNPSIASVSSASIIQAAARIRRVDNLLVRLFVSENMEETAGNVTFNDFFVSTQRRNKAILDDVNNRLELFRRRGNRTIEQFEESDLAREGFFRNDTTTIITEDKIKQCYRLLFFASLTTAHRDYNRSLGYKDIVNNVIKTDSTFSYDGEIVKYVVNKNKKSNVVTIDEITDSNSENSAELNIESFESGLLGKRDALGILFDIYKKYKDICINQNFPFIFLLICLGIRYYKFDFSDGEVFIDGEHYHIYHGIPNREIMDEVNKELTERGYIYQRAHVDVVINRALQWLRRGLPSEYALILAIVSCYSQTAFETLTFTYNNMLFDTKSEDDDRYDVASRRYIESTRISEELLNDIIKEMKSSEEGWRLDRVLDKLNAGKTFGQKMINNGKTVVRHLNILTNMKTKRKRDENGKFITTYKIASIKTLSERLSVVTDTANTLCGSGLDSDMLIETIQASIDAKNNKGFNNVINNIQCEVRDNNSRLSVPIVIPMEYRSTVTEATPLMDEESESFSINESWDNNAELEFPELQTDDEYADNYVPF
jgi:late competence protein required for DNA uptake (superfamily II DNA/RNA helicase)